MRDPDYSPEMAGRLAKLETAISKGRTVKFPYWSIARDDERERTVNPLALLHDMSAWYVIGADLEDEGRRKKFRVSRIRSDIRFATRRERDFRFPATSRSTTTAASRPGRSARSPATRASRCTATRPGGSHARFRNAGTLEDGVFETPYASVEPLASWVLRQNGRAVPLEPPELREEVAAALAPLRDRHEGEPPRPARARARSEHPRRAERLAGPRRPERFGVLQALLAHLLAAAARQEAELDAAELAASFSITIARSRGGLSLLNLVNFGGGCYGLRRAERTALVRVDKELYGDVFRRPPKLTPLEARAIRLALEFVGPMIAADSRAARQGARQAGGDLRPVRARADARGTVETDEERLVTTLSGAMEHHRVVRIEYLKEDEAEPTTREVEPYQFVRELYRTGTCTRGTATPRAAHLPPRPHALRRADGRELRAAAGFRPELPPRPAGGDDPLREAGGALEGRARRPLARRLGRRGHALRDRGMAAHGDPRRPRRGRRPRARAATEGRRRERPRARAQLRVRPRPRGARPAARRSGRGPLPRPDPRPAAAGTRGPFPRGGRGERSGSRRRAPPRRQAGTPDPRCRAAPGWGRSRR